MNYKKLTKETYDRYADEYLDRNVNIEDNHLSHLIEDADIFFDNLKTKKVLELGCGHGRDALYLKEKGLDVFCIDISSKMINICRSKGLNAQVMDFENLTFEDNSFDGVWACGSLLHIPKDKIKDVLKDIKRILKDEGLFYIGLREGNTEGYKDRSRYPDDTRYFAFYLEDEIEEILSAHFEIISFKITRLKDKSFFRILCRNNGYYETLSKNRRN